MRPTVKNGKIFILLFLYITCSGLENTAFAKLLPKKEFQGSIDFRHPEPLYPYFYLHCRFPEDSYNPITIDSIKVNGEPIKYYRILKSLKEKFLDEEEIRAVEANDQIIPTSAGFSVDIPCQWAKDKSVVVHINGKCPDGKNQTLTVRGQTNRESSGIKGWRHYAALVIEETAGIERKAEPVRAMLGLIKCRVASPLKELRVVTFSPQNPASNALGYVEIPCQILDIIEWDDQKLLKNPEVDAKTKEPIRRYMPTTTVQLSFVADVGAYEKKVFLVCYGNPDAQAPDYETKLNVTGKTLSQTVTNERYRIDLSANSGAIMTVTVKGDSEILLEHKLETNGAVHWNPGVYAPPNPWVHASDWENPKFSIQSGPLIHRVCRYDNLPFITTTSAQVTYSFFAFQPYMLCETVMEVKENIFVQALRNGEIVFNHAVLNEFVWKDKQGKIQHLDLSQTREHPIHALEIPPDTPWLAFINRDQGVGFAVPSINYTNLNLYGELPSEAQPYFYVQVGPWIYWSRGLVYPFGHKNFTRMMPVKAGSVYSEINAYLPFRFKKDEYPFEEIEKYQKILTNPLLITEHMPFDSLTPRQWIEPLLTAPFNEGVENAQDTGQMPKVEK
ncbi:MAG TPA: hypothetical protein DCY97_16430 [Marinilabiliales bacterium]|nr:hypothetical protein [Marinilabiliales bacterium]